MTWVENIGEASPFRRYSQCGEEAYIGYILNSMGVTGKGFLVDLGAGDGYLHSNTRYLINEKGWDHILIDGNSMGNPQVKNHWITKDSINTYLTHYKCPKIFDLLSIDLDGNDYWILKQVLRMFRPGLIVAEINAKFQQDESFTIKYDPAHRFQENDFYGVSLGALKKLAAEKKYTVVFVSNCLNAYLVANEFLPDEDFNVRYVYYKKNDFAAGEGEWVEV